MDRQFSQFDLEKGGGDFVDKFKLDYRNDLRFKRKLVIKRKGSMEYVFSLDREELGQDNVLSYNSYNRFLLNNLFKIDFRMNKSDLRIMFKLEQKVVLESVNVVLVVDNEVGGLIFFGFDLVFVIEVEINIKDFFKIMDFIVLLFCQMFFFI